MLSVTTKSGIYNGYKVIGTQTLGLRGLVLWLKFNEGSGNIAYDSSFYNNHSTIYGAVWTDGKFGKALSFDGVDDYVEVPNTSDFHPNALTISVWVYPKPVSNLRGIVDKGGWHPTNKDGEWSVSWLSSNKFQLHFYTSEQELVCLTSPAYEPEHWHHVVAVWNGSVLKLYVNNELVSSAELPSLNQQTYNINIGRTQRYVRYFNGTIDEVRIYSRALSENEIKMLYYNRIGAVPSKTI